MKFIKLIALLFSFALLFLACEKQSTEDIESKTTVVEGYLHAGKTIDGLKITQSNSLAIVDTIIALDDLVVNISDSSNQYALNSIGNGIYQNTELIIENDKNYRLEIERDGAIISAETYIPNKREAQISVTQVELPKIELNGTIGFPTGSFNAVEITWDNSEGDYYYISIRNIEINPEYVNENDAANGGQSRPPIVSEPQISSFYAIFPRREFSQYGTHQIIVYRVNPEYAALYESSGNSTLSLEEPPSNIVNGLGIFTGVSSDTLYLEVNKI
ncbi:MAG: DUF4249 domain-containing protein [Bacteroidetes bacterium]|jgi:hypothetical protein|nr:DUF4249 domain-containing protein [Bacteroidota bacterium]MDF1867752.1 DUF4249 family protein [Saprospiraceae bacterium]